MKTSTKSSNPSSMKEQLLLIDMCEKYQLSMQSSYHTMIEFRLFGFLQAARTAWWLGRHARAKSRTEVQSPAKVTILNV